MNLHTKLRLSGIAFISSLLLSTNALAATATFSLQNYVTKYKIVPALAAATGATHCQFSDKLVCTLDASGKLNARIPFTLDGKSGGPLLIINVPSSGANFTFTENSLDFKTDVSIKQWDGKKDINAVITFTPIWKK